MNIKLYDKKIDKYFIIAIKEINTR